MKKLLFLFACLLQFAFGANAQSKLCITNNTDCLAWVSLYAGAPSAPAPGPYAPFNLRIDVMIPPNDTKCFDDYEAVYNSSVAGWWGGASLPILPAIPTVIGFQWNGAQIQFHECEEGDGVQVGDGTPMWPPFASSTVNSATFGSLPGGLPGDTEIIIW